MKPKQLITILIVCVLGSQSLQAQFFYSSKCFHPDSIFTELRAGTFNAWTSAGFRKEKTHGQQQNNWFSNATLNYLPVKGLETGIHFNKSIPRNQPYSYSHSTEYVPYVRYTVLSNGCYRVALWGDVSYHLDRKRTKEDLLSRSNAPAAGFGLYKTVGKFLWLQVHQEFFIGENRTRNELKLVWKMMNIRLGKKHERKVNFNIPVG